MTQRLTEAEMQKESLWEMVYTSAMQGVASDLGANIESACRKARAAADQAVLDYAARWLDEKAPRAKPARVEGKHGRAEVVMKT
jgi:hypothetical protein